MRTTPRFTGSGEGAGEIMATVQLAMSAELPYAAPRDMIISHHTLAEGIVVLLSAVPAMEANESRQYHG